MGVSSHIQPSILSWLTRISWTILRGFVVEVELPETVCGRIQGQGSQRVFGVSWTSHHVTYSLVLTVDGCLLQGLGRAFGDWLGARTPLW